GELAIKVHVLRKISDKERVEGEAHIPPTIRVGDKEFPTDVVVIAPIAAHAVITDPEKPAQPGTCIGPKGSPMSGTFGCLVVVRSPEGERIPCILSNAHVLALDANGKTVKGTRDGGSGQSILQPGAFNHPAHQTDIATLYHAEPLTLDPANEGPST